MTASFDLVLRGVTLPAAALVPPDRPATGRASATRDVGVRGGIIVAIERGLPAGTTEVAADGALLLPGLVDNHVHYREPGATWKEGYVTGTAASARGGATTIGEVQNNRPLIEEVAQWRAKVASIAGRARVRVLPYGCATRRNVRQVGELARAAPAIKLFMAGDDEIEVSDEATLRTIFSEVAAVDGLLVLHAEDGPLVREGLARHGERAQDFWQARSIEAERVAVARSIELAKATGARIHFFHVSSAAACAAIRVAKAGGLPVSAAACAHYLMFTGEDVGRRGALLKCNPSIKTGADRAALRAAVREGTLDVIQSDHAPHPEVEKQKSFREAPSGISGADLLLELWLALVDEGVLTLDQLVERACVGPARLHRLHDRGRIVVGAVADLVLVEEREVEVRAADFASKAKLSPYLGMRFPRRAAQVWVGGRLVFDRAHAEDATALAALETTQSPPLDGTSQQVQKGERGGGSPPACC